MGEVELSCRAYVKMYLHACLFPRCSINGLLLSSSPTGGAVCVTDCVPLLHSHLPLAPITQLALTQVLTGFFLPSQFCLIAPQSGALILKKQKDLKDSSSLFIAKALKPCSQIFWTKLPSY